MIKFKTYDDQDHMKMIIETDFNDKFNDKLIISTAPRSSLDNNERGIRKGRYMWSSTFPSVLQSGMLNDILLPKLQSDLWLILSR